MLIETNDFLRRALSYDPNFSDALLTMSRLSFLQKEYLKSRAFMQHYEAGTNHSAETLLLAYQMESALGDQTAANTYRLALKTNLPDSKQAAEVRRPEAQ